MRLCPTRISPRRAAFGGLICLLLGAVTTVAVAWVCAMWTAPGRTVTEDPRALFTDWTGDPGEGAVTRTVPNGTTFLVRDAGPPRSGDVCFAYDGFGLTRLYWLRGVEEINKGNVMTRSPALMYNIRGWGGVSETRPTWRWSRLSGEVEEARASLPSTHIIEDAAGWPMRVLASFTEARIGGGWDRSTTETAIFLRYERIGDTRYGMYRALPLRPIFPGFVIDTLLYGALWFGLFFGFGAARRGLRKKRGRCPMCAYDLRGCPAGSRASLRGCPECGWGREEAR